MLCMGASSCSDLQLQLLETTRVGMVSSVLLWVV